MVSMLASVLAPTASGNTTARAPARREGSEPGGAHTEEQVRRLRLAHAHAQPLARERSHDRPGRAGLLGALQRALPQVEPHEVRLRLGKRPALVPQALDEARTVRHEVLDAL